jgi:hypothetical protein
MLIKLATGANVYKNFTLIINGCRKISVESGDLFDTTVKFRNKHKNAYTIVHRDNFIKLARLYFMVVEK